MKENKERIFEGLCIGVIALVSKSELEGGDVAIPGLYSVEVEKELSESMKVAAALDTFHNSFGIENVDHFGIRVFDNITGMVLRDTEDLEKGARSQCARNCHKVRDDKLKLYEVTAFMKKGSERVRLNTFEFFASSKEAALLKAEAPKHYNVRSGSSVLFGFSVDYTVKRVY
jgi:hypothetical protein